MTESAVKWIPSSRRWGVYLNGALISHHRTKEAAIGIAGLEAHKRAPSRWVSYQKDGHADFDMAFELTASPPTPIPVPPPTPVPIPVPVPIPPPTPTPPPVVTPPAPLPGTIPPATGAVDVVLGPIGWPLGTVWNATLAKIVAKMTPFLASLTLNNGPIGADAGNYYDLAWILYLLSKITGDAKWATEGDRVAKWYLDTYLTGSGSGSQPHIVMARGVETLFRRTSYAPAKATLSAIAAEYRYNCYTNAENGFDHYNYYIGNTTGVEQRWSARTLRVLLAAHRTFGSNYQPVITDGVKKALAHQSVDGMAYYSIQTSPWMDGIMLSTLADIADQFPGTPVEADCRTYANRMIPWLRAVYDPANRTWPYDYNQGQATINYGAELNALVLLGITSWTVVDKVMIEAAINASLDENVCNWGPTKRYLQMARALAVGCRVATGIVA